MPRRKLIRQNAFPYHVTIRTINKNWFQIPLCEMWDICFDCLLFAKEKTTVQIHCFVLMNNHYHLLITTPDKNIDKFMGLFNKKLSDSINKASGVHNHKFANRYSWTIIDSENYLFNVYRYIYQNPIRAKLSELCIDYPYSSLRFTSGQKKKLKMTVHIDYFKHRIWMDELKGSDFDECIRKGLMKERFGISNKTGKFIKQELENI